MFAAFLNRELLEFLWRVGTRADSSVFQNPTECPVIRVAMKNEERAKNPRTS